MLPDENIFTRMYTELRVVDRGDVQAEILTQSKHDLWRSPRTCLFAILGFVGFISAVAFGSALLQKRIGLSGWLSGGITGLSLPLLFWLGFLVFRRRRRHLIREELLRRGYAVCLNCGYDLRGQMVPRCPECGSAAPSMARRDAYEDVRDPR